MYPSLPLREKCRPEKSPRADSKIYPLTGSRLRWYIARSAQRKKTANNAAGGIMAYRRADGPFVAERVSAAVDPQQTSPMRREDAVF